MAGCHKGHAEPDLVQCNYQLPRVIAEGIKKRADAAGMKLYRYVEIVLGAHLAKEAKKQ